MPTAIVLSAAAGVLCYLRSYQTKGDKPHQTEEDRPILECRKTDWDLDLLTWTDRFNQDTQILEAPIEYVFGPMIELMHAVGARAGHAIQENKPQRYVSACLEIGQTPRLPDGEVSGGVTHFLRYIKPEDLTESQKQQLVGPEVMKKVDECYPPYTKLVDNAYKNQDNKELNTYWHQCTAEVRGYIAMGLYFHKFDMLQLLPAFNQILLYVKPGFVRDYVNPEELSAELAILTLKRYHYQVVDTIRAHRLDAAAVRYKSPFPNSQIPFKAQKWW
jgi:hypothetical protein